MNFCDKLIMCYNIATIYCRYTNNRNYMWTNPKTKGLRDFPQLEYNI